MHTLCNCSSSLPSHVKARCLAFYMRPYTYLSSTLHDLASVWRSTLSSLLSHSLPLCLSRSAPLLALQPQLFASLSPHRLLSHVPVFHQRQPINKTPSSKNGAHFPRRRLAPTTDPAAVITCERGRLPHPSPSAPRSSRCKIICEKVDGAEGL